MTGTGATASQAWAILKRHARDEISSLRLQELCRDNDRVSSLVSVHNSDTPEQHMLMVDLSRQRMTLETLNHLLRLARARDLKKFIDRLAWGPNNDPDNPVNPARLRNKEAEANVKHQTPKKKRGDTRKEKDQPFSGKKFTFKGTVPSFHLSLRAPKGCEMLLENGKNALTAIHNDWDRLQRLADSFRRGQLPGVTGKMIRDVVVVGRGVTIMALRFIYLALCKDEAATVGRRAGMTDPRRQHMGGQRRMKFVTSVDPVRVAAIVSDLNPASTLVVSIALTGNEETATATRLLKSWLLKSLAVGKRPEVVLSHHMMLVSGNDQLIAANKPEAVFVVPEHSRCEPFCTFSAASLLPLSIVFGWPVVDQFLKGAHDMDKHFVESNPRHNLPVLLGLTDIWNDSLLQSRSRIVTPFTEAFAAYPAFCASLEAQACGNSTQSRVGASSQVVDGGLHYVYDRFLYQTGQVEPSELVMTLDSQLGANAGGLANTEDIVAAQDALLCSMFAHADEMALGATPITTDGRPTSPTAASADGPSGTAEKFSDGNRPSTLLLCGKLDAFACGQLVALAEHRAVVKARIWDIDPFVSETGSALRGQRTATLTERLKEMVIAGGEDDDEEDDDPSLNLSTRTILRHYANIMQNHHVQSLDS